MLSKFIFDFTNFKVKNPIGKGNFGTVFKIENEVTHDQFAA